MPAKPAGVTVNLVMPHPIEPTPSLEGEDADRLLEQLENVCSPEEAKRRTDWARKLLSQVIVPKTDGRAAVE